MRLVILAGSPALARASELPAVRLAQLRHSVFSTLQVAPSGVEVIQQAPDGLLWMVSASGLASFDGQTFDTSLTPLLSKKPSRGLYIEPSGVMWVGHNFGGIDRISGGSVEKIDTRGVPPGTPFDFARTRDGVLWVVTTHGLARMDRAGHWHPFAAAQGYPGGNPEGMVLQPDGTLWVSDATRTWKLVSGQHAFVDAGPAVVIARLYAGLPPDSPMLQGTPDGESLLDRTGAFWQVTDIGLTRTVNGVDGRQVTDAMTPANGLSSDDVGFYFQDDDGDVWVATESAVERFQQTHATPYPLPGHMKYPLIAAGNDNDVYVASDWEAPLRIGRDVASLPIRGVGSAVAREPSGAIWFGGGPSLVRYDHGKTTRVPLPSALGDPRRLVDALAPVAADDVWVNVRQKGLYRFHAGTWTLESGKGGLPEGEPLALDAFDGNVWFGYAGGRVYEWLPGKGIVERLADAGGLGDVRSIAVAGNVAWIGGMRGVMRLEDGHVVSLTGTGGERFADATGVLAAHHGDLWIANPDGLYWLRASDLADARVSRETPFRFFASTDGIGQGRSPVGSRPVIAQSTDGRIWVASLAQVAVLDPGTLPPQATLRAPLVTAVVADAVGYPVAAPVALPPQPGNLRVDYTAPYLADAARVQFRYRLVGYDDQWQMAGSRRQAFFTHLGNGSYTFEVQASLDGNGWAGSTTRLAFSIAPAYFQTWWFRSLVLLGVLGVFAAAQWAWRHVSEVDVHARIDERARLARDLHDTFLQNVQAFILRTHAAMTTTLTPEQRLELLKAAVVQAEDSMREGRDRIGRLRTPTFATDLQDYLHLTAGELSSQWPASFRLDVVGTPVSLVRPGFEQLQPLCQEALINAFRHAQATAITATVRYGRLHLTVVIADDGVGIEKEILRRSRPGHWGLFGMRERASAMGATLRIHTASGSGTRIEMRVGAGRIYARRRG